MEPTQALAKSAQENRLDTATENKLVEMYRPLYVRGAALLAETQAITVTDPSQVDEIKASADARKKYKALRCEAENSRKAANADALAYTKVNNHGYKLLESVILPEEERLEAQEKIAERMQAERIAKLGQERSAEVSKYTMMVPPPPELGRWPQPQYDAFLAGVKAEKVRLDAEAAALLAKAKQAEEDRLEHEAELEMQALIERGKREAAEKKAAAGKKAADAKAQKEREDRERVESESRKLLQSSRRTVLATARGKDIYEKENLWALTEEKFRQSVDLAAQAKHDEEVAAKQAEARKAAAAPDKEKLRAYANAISELSEQTVGMRTQAAKIIQRQSAEKLFELAEWICRQAEKI